MSKGKRISIKLETSRRSWRTVVSHHRRLRFVVQEGRVAAVVPRHREPARLAVVSVRLLHERARLDNVLERDLLAPVCSEVRSRSRSRRRCHRSSSANVRDVVRVRAVEEVRCRLAVRVDGLLRMQDVHLVGGHQAPRQDGLRALRDVSVERQPEKELAWCQCLTAWEQL